MEFHCGNGASLEDIPQVDVLKGRRSMQTAKVVGKGRPLLVDQVMGFLSDYIRREGLSPGDRLPSEADLAERMQCSRNVLREAVGRMTP